MVLAYQGRAMKQCDIAKKTPDNDKKNCCKTPGDCDIAISDPAVGRVWGDLGVLYTFLAAQVPFDALRASINNGNPIEVGLSWRGGGGHVALVIGWNDAAPLPGWVSVNDPGEGAAKGLVAYTSLQNAYGFGVWDATWLSLRH